MTADDALKIADDMENRSERNRSTLNAKALVALAAEVRRLQRKLDAAEAVGRLRGHYIIPDGYAE